MTSTRAKNIRAALVDNDVDIETADQIARNLTAGDRPTTAPSKVEHPRFDDLRVHRSAA